MSDMIPGVYYDNEDKGIAREREHKLELESAILRSNIEERTLFHWPIRKSTTAAFYPDKISIDDFVEFIKDGIDPWAANMMGLNNVKPQYIEWWLECFAAWSEIEEER